ncbi:MAG: hypothetical protein PHQ77_06140 [Proteiniphilum sp.]|nr:hypothetical protein [Proteiniphilum sp.]
MAVTGIYLFHAGLPGRFIGLGFAHPHALSPSEKGIVGHVFFLSGEQQLSTFSLALSGLNLMLLAAVSFFIITGCIFTWQR